VITPPRNTPAVPPGRGGRAVERDRLGQLLGTVAEEHHQQRQRRRRDQCRADALDATTTELHADARRERGDDRAGEQDRPAGGEDAAGSEEIRQTAAEQQQTTESDDVRIEHP